ncbi:MAG: prepilin-type N-terminal cleavage/methylation domain-containing protein [Planctomycetota bacterium]
MKLQQRKNAGFTLIELMIVVAIIAIIASVAIPKLLSARLSANESAAISTLRSISSAQAQFQSSAVVDTDSDGGGEYGFFAELAGTGELRQDDGAGAAEVGDDLLSPAMLSAALGNVQAGGVVTRSGYVFAIFLPDDSDPPVGVAEADDGGMDGATGPNECENFWCCYAWPLDVGGTGNRVFFINQDGDIMQYNNRGDTNVYDGVDGGPDYSAAYSAEDMSAPIANAAAGLDAVDENTWTVVQ